VEGSRWRCEACRTRSGVSSANANLAGSQFDGKVDRLIVLVCDEIVDRPTARRRSSFLVRFARRSPAATIALQQNPSLQGVVIVFAPELRLTTEGKIARGRLLGVFR